VLILSVFTRGRIVYKILVFLVEVEISGSFEIILRTLALRPLMCITIVINLSIRTSS